MHGGGSDLGNDKSVSVNVCLMETGHAAGKLGLSVDFCIHSVLIFFSTYQYSDRLKCPRTYSSLTQFLDSKHWPSSALKEDKSPNTSSSSLRHLLWFNVVIITTREFWHCSMLWGQGQTDLSSLLFQLYFFLSHVLKTWRIVLGNH